MNDREPLALDFTTDVVIKIDPDSGNINIYSYLSDVELIYLLFTVILITARGQRISEEETSNFFS